MRGERGSGSAGAAVGIIANPVSGKDIRRLLANASSSTLQEKYTIVRRVLIGAAEVGVERFLFLPEPHRICLRATETLDLPCRYEEVPLGLRFDESDTVRTAAAMRRQGVGAVVVLGGDGTNRATAIGWPDAPLVPVSTGTNNVFPRFVEATVAGEAAGLVAAGHVRLDEVSRPAKIVEVRIDGEADDLALVDAVLLDERLVGSRALFDPESLRLAVLARAEPAAVGVSSVGGLLEPCGASDEGGVLVRFGDAGRHAHGACGPRWHRAGTPRSAWRPAPASAPTSRSRSQVPGSWPSMANVSVSCSPASGHGSACGAGPAGDRRRPGVEPCRTPGGVRRHPDHADRGALAPPTTVCGSNRRRFAAPSRPGHGSIVMPAAVSSASRRASASGAASTARVALRTTTVSKPWRTASSAVSFTHTSAARPTTTARSAPASRRRSTSSVPTTSPE